MALPPVRPTLRNKFTAGAATDKVDSVEDLIAKGSLLAERNVPSFIPALRASVVVVTDRLPTVAGIDKWWRTYWNPRAVHWLIRAAEAVHPSHPCTTCGATSHNKFAYIAGMWVHEVGHCVFRHSERFEDGGYLDFDKWNMATDLEMNDDIPGMGKAAQALYDQKSAIDPGEGRCPAMCIPKNVDVDFGEYMIWMAEGDAGLKKLGRDMWDMFHPVGTGKPGMVRIPFGMYPDQVPTGMPGQYIKLDDGKIAETYYDLIPDPPKSNKSSKQGQKGQGQGQGQPQKGKGDPQEGQDGSGEGEGEGEGEGQGQGSGQGQGDQQGQGGGSGGQSQGPGTKGLDELNDHGSGSGGDQRDWEDGKPGEGNNALGVTEAESHAVRRDVATKIKESSDGRGTMPAGWQVWADTMLQAPKVRWQDRFAAVVRQGIHRVRGDRQNTFRRLSRSSIVSDCKVIKPSTYDVVPTVVVVVDTSGSMGAGARSRLERALSEAESIIKSQKVKSYFLDCDANVYGAAQDVKTLRTAKVSGGGGTDMRVGVLAAKKNKPKPDIIILLTDGDTPWPSAAEVQGCKLITGICNESDKLAGVPHWMNPIWVDTDR